jgi:succinoglycan biosynthesis protein ExoV
MLLYFHKDPLGNFGDDLNPWLWPKVFPGLFAGEVYHDPKLRAPFEQTAPLFVGIGTLLNAHVPVGNPKIVFGAGVGYGDMPHIDERWQFAFVRGPLTAQRLGLPADKAITDPAVLAANYAEAAATGGAQSLAYMPHCASARHADWAELCDEAGLRFIDPRWPVERVLRALRQTSTLITEALHGAILAEAFRIPWAPVKSSPTVLDFKWLDWCQSIGLDYAPEPLPTLWRPAGTALGRLRFVLKRSAARNALKRLARKHRSQLADEARFAAVKGRLNERVERFRAEHPVVAHTAG